MFVCHINTQLTAIVKFPLISQWFARWSHSHTKCFLGVGLLPDVLIGSTDSLVQPDPIHTDSLIIIFDTKKERLHHPIQYFKFILAILAPFKIFLSYFLSIVSLCSSCIQQVCIQQTLCLPVLWLHFPGIFCLNDHIMHKEVNNFFFFSILILSHKPWHILLYLLCSYKYFIISYFSFLPSLLLKASLLAFWTWGFV